MNPLPLLNSLIDEPGQDSGRSFNVVIIYDNITAGQRAMRIFSKLAMDHEAELRFQPQPWRFDLIADPDWRECATADVLKADLLILSATTHNQLPSTVLNWLTTCLLCQQGALGAVVALLGEEGKMENANSPSLWFLKTSVEKAGVEFFAPTDRRL